MHLLELLSPIRMPGRVTESFNSTQPLTWTEDGDEEWQVHEAKFRIGDGEFVVKFKWVYYEPGYWTLSFTRNGTYDLTSTGSATTVLATVMEATRQFIRKVDPSALTFAGKKNEPSRLKLYPKLIALLQREFPQFSAEAKDGREHQHYTLRRPRRAPVAPAPREVVQDQPMTDAEWDDIEAMLAALGRPS